jgi:aspartyl-tRNA(Asn)/glutamyl-tRNA(Gln) amidotransferase subunit B
MAGWRAAVGLEIHAQILSRSKIFSRGSTEKCSSLNSGIHFFDIGIPGALPILNRKCVEAALISAVTLSARVNRVSYFDRKHYFYPDLPNGYQITQKRKPIAEGGHLDVPLLLQYATALPTVPRSFDNEVLRVDIQRIQLEHDSGKTTYEHYEDGSSATVVDFSRSGCGLMEIVTAPTMCSGAEAASFVKELQLLLRTIKTCDGNMEDGSLRVDANVSVSPLGSDRLGTRSEVKNVSGVRFLARAVDYEINRHVELLESGGEVAEETRFYDERKGITVPTRNKEVYHDYRFLPEPDLPPLCLSDSEEVDDFTVSIPLTTKNLPRIPMVARKDLMKKYGLTLPQASLLLDKQAVVFYETACAR